MNSRLHPSFRRDFARLIAAIAIHHDAELITFDSAFPKLVATCDLRKVEHD